MTNVMTRTRGAVIVTRVSTGEQVKHGTSLESQREACRAKALLLGLPIIAEYEDAGISGSLLLMRKGMQSALADIREGRADTLICANLSRFSRDTEHQQSILKEIRNSGGRVAFCDMDFDETPEGDLALGLMGNFAAYERKVIRARMLKGRRKRAEEGQQPSRSRPPFGYHIVTHADITRGTYTPDMLGRYVLRDDTAPIARRIFEGYAIRNESLPVICRALNAERVPTPGGGRAWREPTLYQMLRNPVYMGKPIAGRIRCRIDEGRIGTVNRVNGRAITTAEVRYEAPADQWLELRAPAIVSEDIWKAVQVRLPSMGMNGGGSPKLLRMLSGLAYCPFCGARVTPRVQYANKVKYFYYLCTNHVKSRTLATDTPCRGDLYAIAKVEESVRFAIGDAIKRPEVIQAAILAYRQASAASVSKASPEQELQSLDKALSRLREQEAAAVQAQIAGIRSGASPDAYAEVFADIAVQRKDLENRRGILSREIKRDGPGGKSASDSPSRYHEAALAETLEVLSSEHLTGADKRALVGTIIEKVVCHKEGSDVYFKPGLFGESDLDEASRSTFQTTCVVLVTLNVVSEKLSLRSQYLLSAITRG